MTADGEPVTRDALATGGFLVAFPEGGDDKAELADRPAALRQRRLRAAARPRDAGARRTSSPTRACARTPAAPSPSTSTSTRCCVCPCHQSTFDVLHGAEPVAGPAGRPLPQLPLAIDKDGFLVRAERLHRDRRPRLLGRHMTEPSRGRPRPQARARQRVRRAPLAAASGRRAGSTPTWAAAACCATELRHIFPDSWAFFLGEIALYCFIVLVATGIFLALFFQASEAPVVYQGSYAPLAGAEMSVAYDSVLDLSLDVPAGLLVRQVHHWAALVFVGALIIHLLRMFLTAAYRRPRRINWRHRRRACCSWSASTGSWATRCPTTCSPAPGLRIAFSITESIPFVGPALASLLFGGEFPTGGHHRAASTRCTSSCCRRRIAGLLGAHLGLLWLQRHTQFPGPGRSDRTIVGTPMVPAYALRTTGYLLLVAGVCTAFGAFVQINPVWLYGPYRPWDATTAGAAGLVHGLAGGRRAHDARLGHPDRRLAHPGHLLAGGRSCPASSSRRCSWCRGSTGRPRVTAPSTTCSCCPASTRCARR